MQEQPAALVLKFVEVTDKLHVGHRPFQKFAVTRAVKPGEVLKLAERLTHRRPDKEKRFTLLDHLERFSAMHLKIKIPLGTEVEG